jgi:hypothetical protein
MVVDLKKLLDCRPPSNCSHNEGRDPKPDGRREADGELLEGEELGALPAVEGEDDPEEDVEDGVEDDVQHEVATNFGGVR